jgi:PAS domain S-box-containing protein
MINWEFTPLALPLFVGSLLMMIIAIVCWMRRSVVGALALMGVCAFAAAYAIGYGFELGATNVNDVLSMLKLQYLSILMPPLMLLVALRYSPNAPKTLPIIYLAIFIIPSITIVLAFTNEYHGLIWNITELDRSYGYTRTIFDPGAWYPISIAYNTTLVALSAFLLIRASLKTRGLYSRQSAILALAVVFPLMTTLLYLADVFPPGLDVIPYSTIFSILFFTYAIFRINLIDVMPVAREAILQGMSEPVIVVDADNRLVYFNEAAQRYASIAPDRAIGKPIDQVFSGWSELLHANQSPAPDDELTWNNGDDKRYFNFNHSPIVEKRGGKSGRLLVLTDITERVKAEQALEQAYHQSELLNKELEAFAHTVAHDLKNPLATIQGFSGLLLDRSWPLDSEKQQLYIEKIDQSASKATKIIDALLMLAGIRTRQTFEVQTLDMEKILLDVRLRLSQQLEDTKAEMVMPSSWLPAKGYAPWVEEIWTNYLSNAIKYGGSPPKIEVGSMAADGGKVCFYVKDNGPGLTPEQQAKLFTPFTRLSQINVEGHGLGLSIVQRVAEKLDGDVGVTSAVGEGSTFTFTLPAAE